MATRSTNQGVHLSLTPPSTVLLLGVASEVPPRALRPTRIRRIVLQLEGRPSSPQYVPLHQLPPKHARCTRGCQRPVCQRTNRLAKPTTVSEMRRRGSNEKLQRTLDSLGGFAAAKTFSANGSVFGLQRNRAGEEELSSSFRCDAADGTRVAVDSLSSVLKRGRGPRSEGEKLREGALDRGVQGTIVEERLVDMNECSLLEGGQLQSSPSLVTELRTHMSPHFMRHERVHHANRVLCLLG